MKNLKIAFVGLSHLGLNYLAASAQKKYSVFGFDNNNKNLKNLVNYVISFKEPNLTNLIKKNKKNIFLTSNFKYLKLCNLVFISEDVKTNKKGKSNYNNLKNLIKKTLKNLNKKTILVILSQMKPGFVRSINFPKNRLFYQVETLVFGNAVNRALKPERIIVGTENKSTKIKSIYLNYLKSFACPILKMNYESAEITKIAINLLLASSVTTTNALSELCEKNSADWQDIMPALKLDKRIGKFSYIKPGLGISGGNIERDIVAAKNLLEKNQPLYLTLNNFLKSSDYMKDWVKRILVKRKFLNKKKMNIGVVGLTYKENTNSIKNSPGIKLVQYLKNKSFVDIYEPMLNFEIKGKNIRQTDKLSKLMKNNKIIIFMRPLMNIKKEGLKDSIFKNKIIIDPYRNIKNGKMFKSNYFSIGLGN